MAQTVWSMNGFPKVGIRPIIDGRRRGVRNVGGVWAGNLWYDFSDKPDFDGLDWNGWVASGKEILGKYADPQFENPEAFDFRLKPSSPASALGFKPWDSSKAGSSGRQ